MLVRRHGALGIRDGRKCRDEMGESLAHFAPSSRRVVLDVRSHRARLRTPLNFLFHPATTKPFAGRALTFHPHLDPQTYAKVNCQTLASGDI